MDLFQIIDDIAKVDPEVYDRFDSRRAAFRNFLGFGKKSVGGSPAAGREHAVQQSLWPNW